MDTLEITGTTCGTPRGQWAAEANASTGTGRMAVWHSCVFVDPPPESTGLWNALTTYWELARLSRRTPWRTIIGPDFAQGSMLLTTAVAPAREAAAEIPVSDAEMVGRVKHSLSLNTSELAAVLLVGRPTVYAWMQGGPIRPANRERLTMVYLLAQRWWQRAEQPLGNLLQLTGADGQSALDLLKADPLDETKLEPFFRVAANRLARGAQEKNERAEPYSVFAERHGFVPVPDGVRERTLRQFRDGGRRA